MTIHEKSLKKYLKKSQKINEKSFKKITKKSVFLVLLDFREGETVSMLALTPLDRFERRELHNFLKSEPDLPENQIRFDRKPDKQISDQRS